MFQLFAEDVRTAAADSVHDVAVQFHAVNKNCYWHKLQLIFHIAYLVVRKVLSVPKSKSFECIKIEVDQHAFFPTSSYQNLCLVKKNALSELNLPKFLQINILQIGK